MNRPPRRAPAGKLLVVCVVFLTPLVWCRSTVGEPDGGAAGRTLHIHIVMGAEGSSHIRTEEWRRKMKEVVFAGNEVHFFPQDGTRERVVKMIARSDIFYFTGHAGVPSKEPDVQVLQVYPKVPPTFLKAEHIRAGLLGKPGPRLVIINGCQTTTLNDGVPEEKRLSSGFGISKDTKGRAYLGWPKSIVGPVGDAQLGKILALWTTPREDGTYRTLREAKDDADNENLTIIGDETLKYRDLTKAPSPGRTWERGDYTLGDLPGSPTFSFEAGAVHCHYWKKEGTSHLTYSTPPKVVREGEEITLTVSYRQEGPRPPHIWGWWVYNDGVNDIALPSNGMVSTDPFGKGYPSSSSIRLKLGPEAEHEADRPPTQYISLIIKGGNGRQFRKRWTYHRVD